MRSSLRTAVSLLLLWVFSCALAQQETNEAVGSWKATRETVRQRAKGWESQLFSDIEGNEWFDEDVAKYQAKNASKEAKEAALASILSRIDQFARDEDLRGRPEATENAAQILARTEYKSAKDAPGKNWIERLLDRLKNLRMKNNRGPDLPEFPDLPWLGPLLKFLMYVILATAIGLLIWLLTKLRVASQMRKARARSGGGILEDGEELLSEDEYLKNADELIAQGRFREACRALYLATLVRLDAARVARLEPAQTNWEHLRRVESNRSKPEGLDFRTPTKLFDHAWYGYSARSAADVEPFRQSYLDIKRLTEERAA